MSPKATHRLSSVALGSQGDDMLAENNKQAKIFAKIVADLITYVLVIQIIRQPSDWEELLVYQRSELKIIMPFYQKIET